MNHGQELFIGARKDAGGEEQAAEGREERRRCPPPLSDGSAHPDWFTGVADEFVGRVRDAAPGQSSANLDEAAICIAAECGARESSRAGGERRGLAAGPVGSAR